MYAARRGGRGCLIIGLDILVNDYSARGRRSATRRAIIVQFESDYRLLLRCRRPEYVDSWPAVGRVSIGDRPSVCPPTGAPARLSTRQTRQPGRRCTGHEKSRPSAGRGRGRGRGAGGRRQGRETVDDSWCNVSAAAAAEETMKQRSRNE